MELLNSIESNRPFDVVEEAAIATWPEASPSRHFWIDMPADVIVPEEFVVTDRLKMRAPGFELEIVLIPSLKEYELTAEADTAEFVRFAARGAATVKLPAMLCAVE